jgi:hypothetical protein
MASKYAKNNKMAPYFVQMREYERRLLKEALTVSDGQVDSAAGILGVTRHYLLARAKLLGGVFTGEPKHEPPGRAAHAWNATNAAGRNGALIESEAVDEDSEDEHTEGP